MLPLLLEDEAGRSLRGGRGLKRPNGTAMQNAGRLASLPSRGAWIETGFWRAGGNNFYVAPFAGGVD